MANYVLGPRAARWLQTQMNGHMTGGRNPGGRPCSVDEQSFCHPFELRWAASSGEGGAGAWIIWLPPGSLVIDGKAVDVTVGLSAASNYPEGWYDLTDVFGGSEVPEAFDLYLDAVANESEEGQDPEIKFAIEKGELKNPVLIARVADGKMVKGVVESAMVLFSGSERTLTLNVFGVEDLGYGDPGTMEWDTYVIKYLTKNPLEMDQEIVIPGIRAGAGITVERKGEYIEISRTDLKDGGGDEEDEEATPDPSTGSFAYDWKNQCILGGVVMVGRQAHYVAGIPATDGSYRVRITFDSGGDATCLLEAGNGFEAPLGSTSYIPVMDLAGGEVTSDYRGAFVVPAYD